jgi:large subunit ribosomal protein L30
LRMAPKRIRITLKRSLIGVKPVHARTAHALGLRKIGGTVEQEMSPCIMGMVRSIMHMLEIEEIGK